MIWQRGLINAPTVLNSSEEKLSTRTSPSSGTARAPADLKAQAGGPIANPGEMAFTHTLAIDVLESIPEYVIEFKQVFGTEKIDIRVGSYSCGCGRVRENPRSFQLCF